MPLKYIRNNNAVIALLFLLWSGNSISSVNNLFSVDDANKHTTVSLHFYQTDIAIILQALADSKQMNLVMTEEFAIKQTIKLQNVDWNKALSLILKSAKLEAEIDGNVLFIKKMVNLDEVDQQKRMAQKEQEQYQSLRTLSLKIKHTDLSTLLTGIQQQGFLSERGKVMIDKRTNTLIVTDLPKQFNAIKMFVAELDKPQPQIHIAAHIVTMSNESIAELGIKWGYSGKSSQFLDNFNVELGVANPTTVLGFNLAKRSGNLLNLELSALEAENQLEIIASPNLLTSNQHTASIKQGTEIPYEVSSGNHGGTSIEFKQAVLGLEVTPNLLSDDRIMLDLYITQNTTGSTIKRSDGGESLAIDTQEIKTQVLIKNGETLVLGGIFQQVKSIDKQGVPVISKVPIVGNLFKYEKATQQKRELVIFITPQLVE